MFTQYSPQFFHQLFEAFGKIDMHSINLLIHIFSSADLQQSKMREAIGVIKPQLLSQIVTNGHIGAALQELDQIATMDVMAVSLGGPVEKPQAQAETQVY